MTGLWITCSEVDAVEEEGEEGDELEYREEAESGLRSR